MCRLYCIYGGGLRMTILKKIKLNIGWFIYKLKTGLYFNLLKNKIGKKI